MGSWIALSYRTNFGNVFIYDPCNAVLHSIADCYHSATLSCSVLSCRAIIFYKFLKNYATTLSFAAMYQL